MKHIFDSSFQYEPSFDTDVRRTFQRIRAQQRTQNPQGRLKLLHLDHFKKQPALSALDTA